MLSLRTKLLSKRVLNRLSSTNKVRNGGTVALTDFHNIPLSDDEVSYRTRMSRLSKEMLECNKLGIRCLSRIGFRLLDGTFVFGPIAVFPMTVLSWRVTSPDAITPESIEFFTLLEPRIDVLIIGAGDQKNVDPVRRRIAPFLKKKRIGFEVMNTEEAIPTFNFLNVENRCVAGGLFPPPELVVSKYEHGKAMSLLRSYDQLDVNPFFGGLDSTLDLKKDIIKRLWGEEELRNLEELEKPQPLRLQSQPSRKTIPAKGSTK
uniref:NADH dehydrogenase [ubiquinone] 1 alpha subcomplex assembly factor 3 n=1 Tax=Syphacia muris TaxID=451379 RepID=A0A0N5AYL9_9BILA